jgi:hypothetical protein
VEGRRRAGRVGAAADGGDGAQGRRKAAVGVKVKGEGEKEKKRAGSAVYVTSLPSARNLALGKYFFKIKKYALLSALAPALGNPTAKHSASIYRVPHGGHSAKHDVPSVICGHSAKYFFIFFILPTKFFVVCSYTM